MTSLKWKDDAEPERHTEKISGLFGWKTKVNRVTVALILMFCPTTEAVTSLEPGLYISPSWLRDLLSTLHLQRVHLVILALTSIFNSVQSNTTVLLFVHLTSDGLTCKPQTVKYENLFQVVSANLRTVPESTNVSAETSLKEPSILCVFCSSVYLPELKENRVLTSVFFLTWKTQMSLLIHKKRSKRMTNFLYLVPCVMYKLIYS